MLPGMGGGELVVIAIVALLVVGPKDLPKLLRQLGRFVGKMRSMADDFRTSFEDMARQSELDDLRKEVEALRTNRIPVLDDIKSDLSTIESDVGKSLRGDTSYRPVDESPFVTEIDESDRTQDAEPLMDGLPPKTAEVPQAKSQPKPKTPRAPRKAPATKVEAKKAETKKVEMKPAAAKTPAKRSRSKTTVS